MKKEIIRVTPRCPIRTTLELIGGKWKLLILVQLAEKPMRYSELKRQIPDISEKMLIQELKNLIDSKLVLRNNFGEVPPRVEYEITDIGQKAIPLVTEITHFAYEYEKRLIG